MTNPAAAGTAVLARECDRSTDALRRRMDAFYATVADYGDFRRERSDHPGPWVHVAAEIARRLAEPGFSGPCRVLELGAGRTGFGAFHRAQFAPGSVHFTAQDVTAQNAEHLRGQADAVHFGPVQKLTLGAAGPFHVAFSTFVLEHVTDPAATLSRCLDLLAPGGVLFVFCPRYDAPFYLSPSAAHLSRPRRVGLTIQVLRARLRTLLTGEPAFLIHHDPAIFHGPFARDRDAVHWVSRLDLTAFFRARGAAVADLPLPAGAGKDWLVKNLLTVSLRATKPPTNPC